MITYQYRIKDGQPRKHLIRMSYAVNYVWNYCNEISMLALRRDGKWLSAYELHALTAGTSKALGLSADTIQQICTEYVTRRHAFRKGRLKWRSPKRSLGWIPFRAGHVQRSNIRMHGDQITYCGWRFRLWLSREPLGEVKTGCFTQDTRGRWYVNLNCEVADETQLQLGLRGVGIDLGVTDQIACSDMTEPYSRENLTRQYEDDLAMAQRAGKKRRVKAIHANIKNARKDWTHKITTAIARRADYIAVGDVSSIQMAKTRMAKAAYDAGWGMVRHQLHYKAIRLAGVCVPVCEMFSSVTCSDCLKRTGPSGLGGLGVRVWDCSHCGASHQRDINAAKNILRLGRQTPIKGILRR